MIEIAIFSDLDFIGNCRIRLASAGDDAFENTVCNKTIANNGILFVTRSATSLSILLSCPTMCLISFNLTEHERVSSLSSHGRKSRETRSSYTFPHANTYLLRRYEYREIKSLYGEYFTI